MKVTRRKLLGSIAIAGGSAGLGAGTFAYLTDGGEAEVSFQSGSIILQISPKTIDFTANSISEGQDNEQDDGNEMLTTITLQNAGTLSAKLLRFTGLTLNGPADLKNNARITTLNILYPGEDPVDALSPEGIDYVGAVNNPNSNEFFDLADVANHLDGGHLEILTAGQELQSIEGNQVQVELGVTYDYEEITSNGVTLTADFDFEAKQDA